MGSDIIRIGSRTFTRNRAFKLGLIDKEGNLTAKAAIDSRTAQEIARAARRAEWRRLQGLDPDEDDAPKAKEVKPLRPKNVTKTGEEVTDPAILAAIAEKEGVPTRVPKQSDPNDERRKAMIEESLLAHGVAPEDL